MAETGRLYQHAPSRKLAREEIPLLDVSPLFVGDTAARAELVQRIRKACFETGFFYVHGTCVGDRCIRAALEATQAFFATPDDGAVKQGVHSAHSGGKRGWSPIFTEPAYQAGTQAHLESFDLGQDAPGAAPNAWPDLPGFRAAISEYYESVTRLGRALAEAFSILLNMDEGFINRHSTERAPRTMRLLHYPANDAPADGRNVGISAHTDFECFTIMHQTAAGLEVTDVNGDWCSAPAGIGSFTVIIGDMLERLSNGVLQATGHRVVNTPWQRYSMVLFFALDGDFEVAPLPQFTGPDSPARYLPVTQDAHIARELKRAYDNLSPET
ncbi:MAG: hypothetical protein GWM87_04550 [Xanthomonadales bacterium]|nr:isopenicillin N synthase family oxygenase [Xanthomonadales bacterium]NIX12279.1 hypothetical protein [Xanthomonadales bacterium]